MFTRTGKAHVRCVDRPGVHVLRQVRRTSSLPMSTESRCKGTREGEGLRDVDDPIGVVYAYTCTSCGVDQHWKKVEGRAGMHDVSGTARVKVLDPSGDAGARAVASLYLADVR